MCSCTKVVYCQDPGTLVNTTISGIAGCSSPIDGYLYIYIEREREYIYIYIRIVIIYIQVHDIMLSNCRCKCFGCLSETSPA